MITFERVLTYIRKTDANYVYKYDDFLLTNYSGNVYFERWVLGIPQPTSEQLDLITAEEINTNNLLCQVKSPIISIIDDINCILAPAKGLLVFNQGYLKIFDGNVWTII